MLKRILKVFIGLIIGYLFDYVGDWIHPIATRYSQQDTFWPEIALVIVFCAIALLALFQWIITLASFVEEWHAAKVDCVWMAISTFISSALIFGALAEPFTSYGPYPWQWTTEWFLVLLAGFIPMALIACGIIGDISRKKT